MNAPKPSSGNDKLWPRMIILGYTVFASSMIGFVFYSSGHRVDLVAPDYYEREHIFQLELVAKNRAASLTPPATLTWSSPAQTLTLVLPESTSPSGVNATVEWFRPSDSRLDRHEKMTALPPGTHALNTAALHPGMWNAKVRWQGEDGEYLVEETFLKTP